MPKKFREIVSGSTCLGTELVPRPCLLVSLPISSLSHAHLGLRLLPQLLLEQPHTPLGVFLTSSAPTLRTGFSESSDPHVQPAVTGQDLLPRLAGQAPPQVTLPAFPQNCLPLLPSQSPGPRVQCPLWLGLAAKRLIWLLLIFRVLPSSEPDLPSSVCSVAPALMAPPPPVTLGYCVCCWAVATGPTSVLLAAVSPSAL